MSKSSKLDYSHILSEMQARHRKIEADLTDQGIKFYPPTTAGERARTLWRRIKHPLLRGASVEITVAAVKLEWHREELRRARTILIDMNLIKPRADGRYLLGSLGPFSKFDELIRDEYLDLKLLEDVVLALSAIMGKSKTHEKPPSSSASQIWGGKDMVSRRVIRHDDCFARERRLGDETRKDARPVIPGHLLRLIGA
jgi:hypothetical protein